MKLNKSNLGRRTLILVLTLSGIILNLDAQTDPLKNLPQYLFPDFAKGIIKMSKGEELVLMVNYNIVTEKMIAHQNDRLYEVPNKAMVDSVIVGSRRFIPEGRGFYEVLYDGPIPLFIQYTGKIAQPGKPAGYGGTSQLSNTKSYIPLDMGSGVFNVRLPEDVIVDAEYFYWISINNEKISFQNERQFMKIFPGKEGEIKKFIKEKRVKFENTEDVRNLTAFCAEFKK
jgi:hypothetical protein